MTDNKDLRDDAVQAIANYIHHEMFEVTGSVAGKMLPWMRDQGDAIMKIVDGGIAAAKADPRANIVKATK